MKFRTHQSEDIIYLCASAAKIFFGILVANTHTANCGPTLF